MENQFQILQWQSMLNNIKNDIYDIESIKNKTGKTALSKRPISLLKVVKSSFQCLTWIGLGYYLLI
jgi:hypothetical protein|tara:strand:+ start:192 stop:389 length:198 start_codon:yes stop_codon:yes gene_type:complete